MNTQAIVGGLGILAVAAVLTLSGVDNAIAGPSGGHGGGGGFHGGGGGFHGGGGSHGSGRGGQGQHFGGGYYLGGPGHEGFYHGGYGYHRGYGRWRGGWGGMGLGWYLPALPLGYSTLWWGGVPYYYADDSYYLWDDGVGQYEAVEPPSGPPDSAPSTSAPATGATDTNSELFAYPKAGQSQEQQARDRDECRKWAVSQTGLDPTQSQNTPTEENLTKHQQYLRAEAACLQARDYSVK
jgi:hypothetical protein